MRRILIARWRLSLLIVGMVVGFLGTASRLAHAQYNSAQEARSAGAKLYNARKYAEARAPLEAAIALADDAAFKVGVYRALLQSYRQLPEIDHFLQAADFICQHSESAAERLLTARSLASFVHERGKTADAVKIYEAQLAANPQSKPALCALSAIYLRAEPNPTRRAELLVTLAEVQRQEDALLAEKLEKSAAQQPALAAPHFKDAAAAWQRAGNVEKARAALASAEANGPDARTELLAHFWHKGMADTYLALNQPKQAIPHYEQAITKTSIAGYIQECQQQLAKARQADN